MERLIPSFTRVQLGLDQPSDLIARFPQLKSAALSSSSDDNNTTPCISPSDILLLLDRPPLSPSSPSSSPENNPNPNPYPTTPGLLLHHAINQPHSLSSPEIDLLRRRFWPPEQYDPCQSAWASALADLERDTSEEYMKETVARLRRVREALGGGEEERAFEAARGEWVRRLLSSSGGGEAKKREGCWGYAIYYVDDDEDANNEDFQSRVSAALQWARDVSAVARGQDGKKDWTLFRMEWPPAGSSSSIATATANGKLFERLRRDFRMARDDGDALLPEGLLRNVFLMVDRDSVRSVMSGLGGGGVCDDMWVWAVDPEYEDREEEVRGQEDTVVVVRDDVHQETAATAAAAAAAYPGYLRVRLQQLVSNFYAARREDRGNNNDDNTAVVPMETLWACAQKSYQGAFVSGREEDFMKWLPTRDVGSCLRQ